MLKRIGQIATVATSLAVLPFCANAQRGAAASMAVAAAPHSMAMPMAAPAMHAAPVHVAAGVRAPMHIASSGGAHPVAPHHPWKPATPRPPVQNYPVSSHPTFPNAPFPSDGFFNDGGYPVPGLGFDYPHFAAVHPGIFNHHFRGGTIVPFIGGGIFVPVEYFGESAPVPEQPAESNEEPEQARAQQPDYSAPSATETWRQRTVANTSVPPSPEFIFVRRDGSVFFAVAFSWTNGNLQYITQEGLRKVVPLTALDLDATSQFNEQRGLSFRSPA